MMASLKTKTVCILQRSIERHIPAVSSELKQDVKCTQPERRKTKKKQ